MNFYVELVEKQAADLAKLIKLLQNSYLIDKTIPLDERWDAYLRIAPYLPINPWVTGNLIEESIKPKEVSLYDDFNIQRYQTVKYADQVEGMQDELEYDAEGSTIWTKESVIKFQELVLASGVQGFIMDW